MDDELRDRLRRKSVEASRRLRGERGERSEGEDRAPSPGMVYMLQATADHGIEWLLIEVEEGGFWAVPADTVPLIGPGDLALETESLGPLTLRCMYGVLLYPVALKRELHSGRLPAADLAQARQYCHRQRFGLDQPTLAQQEVALDPEYREWQEVLAAARSEVDGNG